MTKIPSTLGPMTYLSEVHIWKELNSTDSKRNPLIITATPEFAVKPERWLQPVEFHYHIPLLGKQTKTPLTKLCMSINNIS